MHVEYVHKIPLPRFDLLGVATTLTRPILIVAEDLLSGPLLDSHDSGNIIYFDTGPNPLGATITQGVVLPNREGIQRVVTALNGLYTMPLGPDCPSNLVICAYGSRHHYDSWSDLVEVVANFSFIQQKARFHSR